MEENRVLRPKEVARLVGVSTRQIANLNKSGRFVPKIKMGNRSVGYELRDVLAWIEARKAA